MSLLLLFTPSESVATVDAVTDNAMAIYQKSDFVYQFTVLASGVAVDITGATFAGMFRWQYADVEAVFSLTTEITVVTAGNGTAKITILSATTGAVVVPTTGIQSTIGGGYTLYYDINMTLNGVVSRVLRGQATFYRSALQ